MDVSIVIRTKNEAEFIGDTLEKVMEQELKGAYEVIIVDSGSTDSTLQIVRKHDVKLLKISQEEFTYGRALNMGAMNSEGNYIVNLSAHAFPRDNNWLTNLITGFEDENVAGVYGRQLSRGHINPFEALQNDLFFGEEKIRFSMSNNKGLRRIHFSNSNCAVRKDVWQRFSFNEQVPYAEDTLWQAEVMNAGFSIVYTPDAAVYHTHRVSIGNAYRSSRDCAYALALMNRKKRSFSGVMCDTGICLGLIPNSMFHNLSYICRNNYCKHLTLAPFCVMSGQFGWLVGRIRYRVGK